MPRIDPVQEINTSTATKCQSKYTFEYGIVRKAGEKEITNCGIVGHLKQRSGKSTNNKGNNAPAECVTSLHIQAKGNAAKIMRIAEMQRGDTKSPRMTNMEQRDRSRKIQLSNSNLIFREKQSFQLDYIASLTRQTDTI